MKEIKCEILTDVYYIYYSDAFEEEAVPLYEMVRSGVSLEVGKFLGFLYIEKGTKGYWSVENGFESVDGSTTRLSKEYIKIIED
jgi:hypothetical protein